MSKDQDQDQGKSKGGLGQAVIDGINPIWHLPLIGAVSRWVTGKKVSRDAEMIGGIYNAGVGMSNAIISRDLEKKTGMGLDDHLMVTFGLKSAQNAKPAEGSSVLTDLALKVPGVSEVTGQVSSVVDAVPKLGGSKKKDPTLSN